MNLEPYSLEHLEAKDLEELRKLYSVYFQIRKDYRKKLKEKTKIQVKFENYDFDWNSYCNCSFCLPFLSSEEEGTIFNESSLRNLKT